MKSNSLPTAIGSNTTKRIKIYHGRHHTKKQRNNEKPTGAGETNPNKKGSVIVSTVKKETHQQACSRVPPPMRRNPGANRNTTTHRQFEWPFIN